MRLVSLVFGLFTSIIYLMDCLYLQQGLESRPCREIVYIYNAFSVLCSDLTKPIGLYQNLSHSCQYIAQCMTTTNKSGNSNLY
jgi:hypothetical protein